MADHPAEERPEGAAATERDGWAKARTQHLLAVDGLAEGQCPSCRAYTLDGAAPTLHTDWCSR